MAVGGAAGCWWAKRAPLHDVSQHHYVGGSFCARRQGEENLYLRATATVSFFLKSKDRLHMGYAQCGLTIRTMDLFSRPFFRQQ